MLPEPEEVVAAAAARRAARSAGRVGCWRHLRARCRACQRFEVTRVAKPWRHPSSEWRRLAAAALTAGTSCRRCHSRHHC